MLSDYVKPETVLINLESTEKDSLFAEMIEILVRCNPSLDRDEVMSSVLSREEQMNTCVMNGVAVPHGVCESLKSPLVAVGVSRAGIDYEIDGIGTKDYSDNLVHLVVLMLFEQGNAEKHLHVLADCARVLHIPGFYKALLSADSAQEVCNLIREYETSY